MVSTNQIKPDLTVVCLNNFPLATVDHMEGGSTIKLKKDKEGQHHYIPLSWVSKVDDKIHIDRPRDQAVKEWSTTPNMKSAAAPMPAGNKPKIDAAVESEKSASECVTKEDAATEHDAKAAEKPPHPKNANAGKANASFIPNIEESRRAEQKNKPGSNRSLR